MTRHEGAGGRVVIPKELRDQVGLSPGSEIKFELVGDGVVVRSADRRSPLRGRFAGSGLAARLLEDRRRER